MEFRPFRSKTALALAGAPLRSFQPRVRPRDSLSNPKKTMRAHPLLPQCEFSVTSR